MYKIKIGSLLALWLLLTFTVPQTSYAFLFMSDIDGSTEQLGQFEGELRYSYSSSTQAQLTISLTNTSPESNGGFLVAFALNNPFNYITGGALSENDGSFVWNLLGATGFNGGIPSSSFGDFDIGASITNQWLGGGGPNNGVEVNETVTFTFDLTGTNLDLLTDLSFLNAVSSSGEFFVARFRGFEDGGSDKVPGIPFDGSPIPEPATLILLGSGLVGLAGVIRKRRKS